MLMLCAMETNDQNLERTSLLRREATRVAQRIGCACARQRQGPAHICTPRRPARLALAAAEVRKCGPARHRVALADLDAQAHNLHGRHRAGALTRAGVAQPSPPCCNLSCGSEKSCGQWIGARSPGAQARGCGGAGINLCKLRQLPRAACGAVQLALQGISHRDYDSVEG